MADDKKADPVAETKAAAEAAVAKQKADKEAADKAIADKGAAVPQPKGDGPDAPPPPPGVAVGVDPRSVDGSTAEGVTDIPGAGYIDQQGGLHAAPPTPTRETAVTANDEPGAGGLPAEAQPPRRAKLVDSGEKVVVNVPRPFMIHDDASSAPREIQAGEQEMSVEAANHWYAKANGVEILDKAPKASDAK